jgi:vitamin B12 transporter
MAGTIKQLLLIWLLSLGISLYAQDRDSTYVLDQVVVEDKSIIHHGVDHQQGWNMESQPTLHARQVSDVLKFFSGVTVKDYGGVGGLKSVSVRGLGAHHTALSYDGVVVNDAQSGQIDFGKYSLENVERISLIMGNPTDLRSTASDFASGSMVKINSIKPSFKGDSTFRLQVNLTLGSFQYWKPSIGFQQRISNKIAHSTTVDYHYSEGNYPFVIKNGNQHERVRRLNSGITSFRVEENIYITFTEQHQLNAKLYYYQSDRSLPGPVIYNNTHSSQRLQDENFFIQTNYNGDLSSRFTLSAHAKYSQSYMQYDDPDYLGTTRQMHSRYKQQETFGSITLAYQISPSWKWGNATDLQYATLQSNEHAVGTPTRLLSISSSTLQFKNVHWLLQGGGLVTRATDWSIQADKTRQRVSPYFSLGYYTNDSKWLIRFFYKDLYRLPTFNDLYYYAVGNLDLVPETIQQCNVGVVRQLDLQNGTSMSFSVDGYHNAVENKIVALPTRNVYLWTMMNVGRASITGIEGSFNSHYPLKENLSVFADLKYTYQEVLDKTSPTSKTFNHQLAYTPKHTGSSVIGIAGKFGRISHTAFFVGRRYMLNQNIEMNLLKEYMEHSLSYTRDIILRKSSFVLSAEMLNLFNTQYEIVKNFPMPRRSFRISVQFKLEK